MYYITKKDSETGKKFRAVKEKMDNIHQKQGELAEKYGFSHFINKPFCVIGQIQCVAFEDHIRIDPKIWALYEERNERKFYTPKLSTSKGKQIRQDFDTLDKVFYSDINACIGFDSCRCHIGFNFNNDDYFGFETDKEWEVEIPTDCEEITFKRWKEIFKEEE